MKLIVMALAVLVAAGVNFGTFIWAAGKTGDGYWAAGDAGLYFLSLIGAAAIIGGAARAIYG